MQRVRFSYLNDISTWSLLEKAYRLTFFATQKFDWQCVQSENELILRKISHKLIGFSSHTQTGH